MERWDRLIEHLLKLEKLTGRPLRDSPRFVYDKSTSPVCPIMNFAPSHDGTGRFFYGCNNQGVAWYLDTKYEIYDSSDSDWWHGLSPDDRAKYTDRIVAWLAERKEKDG